MLSGEGKGGARSYDGEKAWSSINHSILSVFKNIKSKQSSSSYLRNSEKTLKSTNPKIQPPSWYSS